RILIHGRGLLVFQGSSPHISIYLLSLDFLSKKRAGYLFDNLLFCLIMVSAPYLNDIAANGVLFCFFAI
ncbi:hypothetical protein, partial [Paenibacillus thiaminolyticus]|uniref:hypothetical protein n=1 Tax=Paenibacillus thiaminolyticus TaxID=49283 RepID=UPI00227FBCA7